MVWVVFAEDQVRNHHQTADRLFVVSFVSLVVAINGHWLINTYDHGFQMAADWLQRSMLLYH